MLRLSGTPTRIAASILAACVGHCGLARADVTIPGNVVIPAGGTLTLNDNYTFTGSLTIDAGASVVSNGLWRLNIGPGASLTVNGTEADPVAFYPQSGEWNGLHLQAGSSGAISHATFVGVRSEGVLLSDATAVLDHVWIHDQSPESVQRFGPRHAVMATGQSDLTVRNSTIGPFYGRRGNNGADATTAGQTGSRGGDGMTAVALGAYVGPRVVISNTRFIGIRGGQGGTGGKGGPGLQGDDAPYSISFNGQQGGTGGTGGTGGRGGDGGQTTGLDLYQCNEVIVAQNLFETMVGGLGGTGGKGGTGGTGGAGGDGQLSLRGNGGNGGAGGTGGTGGTGGAGGWSDTAFVIIVNDPLIAPVIVNNTFHAVTASPGGAGGAGGDSGAGGVGGHGGKGAAGYQDGKDGAVGSAGATGPSGSPGQPGDGQLVTALTTNPAGTVAFLHNNIGTFTGPGPTTSVLTANCSVEGTNNLVDASTASNFLLVYGTYNGSFAQADPLFTNPAAGDFTLMPGSPAIDAGDNSKVPAFLTTDFNGAPRFRNDPATPDTGQGTAPIVDLGAFEFEGCPADLNGDGFLDNGDIGTFITLFLAGNLAADLNSDGFLDNGDIGTFITLFLAGC